MMKIYVTKYALTAGISKHDAEIDGSVAVVKEPGSYMQIFHGEG